MKLFDTDKTKELIENAKRVTKDIASDENIELLKNSLKNAVDVGSDVIKRAGETISEKGAEAFEKAKEKNPIDKIKEELEAREQEKEREHILKEEQKREQLRKEEEERQRLAAIEEAKKNKAKFIGIGALAAAVLLFAGIGIGGSKNTVEKSALDEVPMMSPAIAEVIEATPTPEPTPEPTPVPTPKKEFVISFLACGEGDCAVIQSDGHVMIVDGGPSANSQKLFTYMKQIRATNVDYMICTHPDTDHCAGLHGALQTAKVENAIMLERSNVEEVYTSLISKLDETGCNLLRPENNPEFELGSAKVELLGPSSDANYGDNTSIVTKITYGDTVFLLMGDAPKEEELAILTQYPDLKADVIKISHHGSDTATSAQFISAVKPDCAVISVGGDNTYGHPTEKVLNTLKENGVKLYRTDIQGIITIISDGHSFTVNTGKLNDFDTYTAAGGYDNMLKAQEEAEKAAEEARIAEEEEAKRQAEQDKFQAPEYDYVANTNSYKFHYSYCRDVAKMKAENKAVYHCTRDQMLAYGYSPCGHCNP